MFVGKILSPVFGYYITHFSVLVYNFQILINNLHIGKEKCSYENEKKKTRRGKICRL